MLPLMRRAVLTCALSLLTLTGASQAADYSKAVWSIASGQSGQTPLMDTNVMGEMVMRAWVAPRGVPVQGLMFIYMPKLSTNHWAVMLVEPQGQPGEFFGARSLKFVRAAKRDGQTANLYTLGDGMFRGLYLMDGKVKDKRGKIMHVLMLLTPQMAQQEPDPADFLN